VETVDFAPDGGRELVVSVLTAGATEGPLEVWVLALEDGSFRTEVYERTARGGDLAVDGDRLILEFGVYRPGDPGCCPSLREHLVIGFDPESGGIAVLRRVRRPVES
jgi:hypothetical protein